jgi:predicted nucleic acid-binding protein
MVDSGANATDTLIAATAAAHELPLYTRDRHFDMYEDLDIRFL